MKSTVFRSSLIEIIIYHDDEPMTSQVRGSESCYFSVTPVSLLSFRRFIYSGVEEETEIKTGVSFILGLFHD